MRNKQEKQPVPPQKDGVEKQPETVNNVPRVTPRPKRPPPPKPPAPYRKKSATYVQLEENSANEPETDQSEASVKETAQSFTEKSESIHEEVPYEVPISHSSTLETIAEGDGIKPDEHNSLPVAPPRRRKNDAPSPKVPPRTKVSLGRIPKAPSAPVLHNGDSSTISTRKTSDVVVAVQPPKYTEEELEKCSVSDHNYVLLAITNVYFTFMALGSG